MSDRLRTALGAGLTAGALLLCALAAALRPGNPPAVCTARKHTERKAPETARLRLPDSGGIDVNTAGEDELTKLQGIGPTLAEAIAAEREDHGPFYYPEDLLGVSGIGTQKLNGIRELIRTDAMEGQ